MESQKIKLLPNRQIKVRLKSSELTCVVRLRKGKFYLDIYETDGTPIQTVDLTSRGDSAQFAIGTQPPG